MASVQNPQIRQQSLTPSTHDRATLETRPSNGSSASAAAAAAASAQQGPRRTSFNFLRRQKSSESRPPNQTGKMSKKQRAQANEELARQQREAAALGRSAPRLPQHAPLPTINAFGGSPGGGEMRPDSVAIATNRAGGYSGGHPQTQGGAEYHAVSSHVPIPPIPQGSSNPGSRNGDYNDPYARTESMTHRGRYSYASSAISMGTINSPRRVRRRRDPTPFKYVTQFYLLSINWRRKCTDTTPLPAFSSLAQRTQARRALSTFYVATSRQELRRRRVLEINMAIHRLVQALPSDPILRLQANTSRLKLITSASA